MHKRAFDGLARHVTTRQSRRALLGLVLGLGLALVALPAGTALADHVMPPDQIFTATQHDGNSCANAVISSSLSDATAAVERVDEMRVAVNGVTVYAGNAGTFRPAEVVGLGPVSNGDRLSVQATHNPAAGQFQQLSPLYLHCLNNDGRIQTLDSIGYPLAKNVAETTQQAPDWTFYDGEFTIAMIEAIDAVLGEGLGPH
jgi:hypothetical protein